MTTYRISHASGPVSGSGLFQKYPGEHHFPGYSYLGPHSRTDIRLDENLNPKKGEEPINSLDEVALKHDVNYIKIKNKYDKDHDKEKALREIHKVDADFIRDSKNSSVQPLGNIASKIIQAKVLGEKTGILNSKTFSDLGVKFTTKDGKTVSFQKKEKNMIQQQD